MISSSEAAKILRAIPSKKRQEAARKNLEKAWLSRKFGLLAGRPPRCRACKSRMQKKKIEKGYFTKSYGCFKVGRGYLWMCPQCGVKQSIGKKSKGPRRAQ